MFDPQALELQTLIKAVLTKSDLRKKYFLPAFLF